jgi:hypothetical protein
LKKMPIIHAECRETFSPAGPMPARFRVSGGSIPIKPRLRAIGNSGVLFCAARRDAGSSRGPQNGESFFFIGTRASAAAPLFGKDRKKLHFPLRQPIIGSALFSRLLKEIGPTAARFPLKIQPLSFQWVVFSSTRPKPATLQKNVAETNALKL